MVIGESVARAFDDRARLRHLHHETGRELRFRGRVTVDEEFQGMGLDDEAERSARRGSRAA